jgi:hypothetical protein
MLEVFADLGDGFSFDEDIGLKSFRGSDESAVFD